MQKEDPRLLPPEKAQLPAFNPMKTSKALLFALLGCGLLTTSLSAQRAPTVVATPARPVAIDPADRERPNHDRIEAARIKAARLKAARIKNAREDAADDDDRRRHHRPEVRPTPARPTVTPVRPAVTTRPTVTPVRPAITVRPAVRTPAVVRSGR